MSSWASRGRPKPTSPRPSRWWRRCPFRIFTSSRTRHGGARRRRAGRGGRGAPRRPRGGGGLYERAGLTDVGWRRVRTPFGDPSDEYCTGTFEGRPVIFLPRHGRGHRLTPTELNFRANIWGLKSLGAEWVISVSAVGSMKETIHPLDLVVPNQFFDATKRRVSSFFGEGIVAHVRSEEHTSELQSPCNLVCRLLLEKKQIVYSSMLC